MSKATINEYSKQIEAIAANLAAPEVCAAYVLVLHILYFIKFINEVPRNVIAF